MERAGNGADTRSSRAVVIGVLNIVARHPVSLHECGCCHPRQTTSCGRRGPRPGPLGAAWGAPDPGVCHSPRGVRSASSLAPDPIPSRAVRVGTDGQGLTSVFLGVAVVEHLSLGAHTAGLCAPTVLEAGSLRWTCRQSCPLPGCKRRVSPSPAPQMAVCPHVLAAPPSQCISSHTLLCVRDQ